MVPHNLRKNKNRKVSSWKISPLIVIMAAIALYMVSHSITFAVRHHNSSSEDAVDMNAPSYSSEVHHQRSLQQQLHEYKKAHHGAGKKKKKKKKKSHDSGNDIAVAVDDPKESTNMLQQIRLQRAKRHHEEDVAPEEETQEDQSEGGGVLEGIDAVAKHGYVEQSDTDEETEAEAKGGQEEGIVEQEVGEKETAEEQQDDNSRKGAVAKAPNSQLLQLASTLKHKDSKQSLVAQLRSGNLMDRKMAANLTKTHSDKKKGKTNDDDDSSKNHHSMVLTPLRGITFTDEDPDGLQQRIQRRWESADCLYNDTLLPPQIRQIDGAPLIAPRTTENDRPFTGVLLDAARHFFPLEWLYGLVDFLAVLGYDWIHFRIVDDESFVLRLDSHPELAVAVHPTRTKEIYTVEEMRAFVQYAKSKGISILPEVNVPGHAGGWQGIPGMLLPCTSFISNVGKTIPLHVDNPLVLTVIEDVLREVMDIFSTAPYLHLGGDELWMSEPCLHELQLKPNYAAFERKLEDMLVNKLNYPTEKVIRWEQTGKTSSMDDINNLLNRRKSKNQPLKEPTAPHRAGKITHWWFKTPPNETDTAGVAEPDPFFISTDLYFDASLDRDAWDIFGFAKSGFKKVLGMNPTAVLPATFELGPCTWNVRNVWGKLVAVAMAADETRSPSDEKVFMAEYLNICRNLGLSESICLLEGKPAIPTTEWKLNHLALHDAWSATVSDRLTFPEHKFGMRFKDKHDTQTNDVYAYVSTSRAFQFKQSIEKSKAVTAEVVSKDHSPRKKSIYKSHVYKHTGVMIDLAHDKFDIETMHRIIDVMSILGFNLLHLRLVGNESFAIDLMEQRSLASHRSSHTEDDVKNLVAYAARRGVNIMPEINFLSNAGGWYRSGLLVDCPKYICDVGGPIPVNIHKGRAMSTFTVVCGHLLSIFNTSPFFHLGSFDQQEAEPCYKEAYPMGELDLKQTFENFQTTMKGIFYNMGIDKFRILRYESGNEGDDSFKKLGGVTHFYETTPVESSATPKRFFLSADVSMHTIGDDDAWDIYQHTRASYNSGATGVIVGTKGMDSDAWDSQNILGRLVAIAAGLSSSSNGEMMDKTTFHSQYAKTCTLAGLSAEVCDSFGKPVLSASAWESKRESLQMELQNKRCEDMTHRGVSRFPRASVFG